MSSSSAAHPDNAQVPLTKRTRSTLNEPTPNKQARVSASAGALDGVQRLQNILPRRLSITSPRDRRNKKNEASKPPFSWLTAFSHLQESGVGVMIFEVLPFIELRNAAFTCKSFHALVMSDASLSWRFHLSGAPEFVELLSLEDRTPRARKLTTSMLQMRQDLFVKFRKILFDWLVDVQGEYRLSTETLHIAFNLIDRCFQEQWDIPTAQIQLLGATCLFIAAKMNETTHPSTTEMAWVCDNAFTQDEFRSMEMQVLFGQQFKVRSVTPFEFVGALCLLLDLPPAIKSTASYLIDLFMLESDSIGVPSSAIAGASVIFSVHCRGLTDTVNFKDIAYVTRTPAQEIRELMCKMQWFYFVDYFTNNEFGKADRTVVRPLTDWHGLGVNRRHSRLVENDLECCPAAQVAPPRIKLLQTGSCPWCRKDACGHKLEQAFQKHVDRVHTSMVPCGSLESKT